MEHSRDIRGGCPEVTSDSGLEGEVGDIQAKDFFPEDYRRLHELRSLWG